MATKKSKLQYVIDGYVNNRFYKSIKSAQNALARTNNFLKGNNTLQAQSAAASRKASGCVASWGGGLLKTAIGLGAAYLGTQQLISGYKSVMEETEGQIRANTRLQTLMLNNKGTTLANVHAVQRFAQAQMKYTTIADDVITTGASQISTFQLNARTIQKLLPAFQNLAVGQHGVNVSQDQAIQTANLIGKVYTGQVGALRRVGISFTKVQEKILKTGSESEKTAMLIKVINQNYGGLAKKMAQTPEGRILRLKNAWGEIKEEIGYKLLPVQEKVLKYLSDHLPQIQAFINNIIRNVEKWAVGLKPVWDQIYKIGKVAVPMLIGALKKVWDWASGIVKVIVGNWDWFGPIIKSIVIALLAWKAVTAALAIAQGALNIVLAATAAINPVALIVIGVGALIGLIIALIKNWDKVKAAMSRAWQWFIRFATEGPGRFIPVINIIGLVAKHWDVVKAAIVRVWHWVVKFVGYIIGGAFGGIKAAIKAVINVWNGVWGTIKHVWQWAQKLVYFIVGAEFRGIKKVIEGITVAWDKVVGAVKKAVDWITQFYDKAKAALGLKHPAVKQAAMSISAARASGGPVSAGRAYLVGERGPEYFVPKISGMILPNKAPRMAAAGAGSGGGITVNLTVNSTGAGGNIKDDIKQGTDYLIRELRKLARDEERRSFA